MHRLKNPKRGGGFTLAEILVVVMILCIAAAMVIPNVVSTSDLQVVSAARILTADLQYAQNVAITSQTPVTVSFDLGAKSYTLSNQSGPLIHPMTRKAYTQSFSPQGGFDKVQMVSASFGGQGNVTFDMLGAANNAGTVTLQAGPHRYQVSVSAATGKVTVTSTGS